MLHDAVFSRADASAEPRRHPRVPLPAELVLVWHHDLQTPIRYRVIDASDGGVRIRTTVPVVEGMTGTALKLLPQNRVINRPVMVVWVASSPDSPEHEAGLRYF